MSTKLGAGSEMKRHSRLLGPAFAGALLLSASATHAETSLALNCKPDLAPDARDKDPVVSVAVSVNGFKWRVTHLAASGKRYERAEYDLHDVPDQGTWARIWRGTSINRPYLKMVGQIIGAGNNSTYVESLYDARKNGARVLELKFSCVSAEIPQTMASPQASTSSNSDCSAVKDLTERLACYDKVLECLALKDPRQRFVCYEGLARALSLGESSPELKPDITDPNTVMHGDCLESSFPNEFPTNYSYCLAINFIMPISNHPIDRGAYSFMLSISSNGSILSTSGDASGEVFDASGTKFKKDRFYSLVKDLQQQAATGPLSKTFILPPLRSRKCFPYLPRSEWAMVSIRSGSSIQLGPARGVSHFAVLTLWYAT